MKSEIPKQFISLCNTPILLHTLRQFVNFDKEIEIIVVLPESQFPAWNEICLANDVTTPHKLIKGGKTRFESVSNGLSAISHECVVGIHDAVRPLVSLHTIARCYAEAEASGSAVPTIPLRESLRIKTVDGSKSLLRNNYLAVQTPQCFHSSIIKKAYEIEYDESFTDDASVLEAANLKINTVDGNVENIKITVPMDLIIAEALIRKSVEK